MAKLNLENSQAYNSFAPFAQKTDHARKEYYRQHGERAAVTLQSITNRLRERRGEGEPWIGVCKLQTRLDPI